MTRLDRIISIAVLGVAVVLAAAFKLIPSAAPGPVMVIKTRDKEALRSGLDGQRTITVTGPVGKSVVEVADGRVHMLTSDCPDKICVGMGWITRPGQVVVCMPNRVVISLEQGAR